MPRVQAPNGDIYDLDASVASGLVGSPSGEWKLVDEKETKSTGSGKPAKAPATATAGDSGHATPKANASREVWAKYAKTLGIDPGELKQGQLREAVSAKQLELDEEKRASEAAARAEAESEDNGSGVAGTTAE